TQSPEEVIIPLDSPPLKVVIDGDYAIMRTLDMAEQPPILADIMGSESILVAAPAGRKATYKPLVDALGVKAVTWTDPGKLMFSRLETATVLIAGFDNPLAARLLGGRKSPDDGIRLEIHKNPYAPAKRLLLMHAADTGEAMAVIRKLSHYGKYSVLAFQAGHNTHKATGAAENGLAVLSRPAPLVLRPEKKEVLADIFTELRRTRVVFVGEQHDNFAHHLNQLQVIQALRADGEKIGVAMEMFQTPYQPVIDAYLDGKIDERTFLAQSEYYDRWRYNYHLYKPIVDFLKSNRIPLVALNVSGDISRQTGRQGLDSLSPEQRRQVPARLDFSDETYRRDLKQVFDLHGSETGLDEFNYFYQAQTLWDEAMASTAARWLTANPERKLVVLAGNGHLRHKYGIPRRLHRRTAQPYAVIVQDEEIEKGIADYVLLTTEIEGTKAPKLGILVEEQECALVVKSAIEHGPAGKAGLEADDVIIALDGHSIKSLADLKLALFYTK
ncbi:MAG: PDZ domain-containing protein, partial [Desulfobacterales bacterium]|nr:PDZ domain-containing protein [Desulfobacterales bacterium]